MDFFISAAHADAGGASPISSIIMLVGFVAIFYFLLIRPQQKRAKEHKNLLAELAKGDEVTLAGGLMGRITKVTEEFLVLEIAQDTSIKVQKAAVTAVLPKGTLKAVEAE
ncbi:preprotein translocase subunit YajC [Marinospirillum alkaliphilum]|uniref:Sec translocon accessory complex subunit YajC n=1 Tax=Marinospirillum alkaliphilum DSM 21637 TaxID=1122209 RepID=A0A1K1VXY3_9GAMM|nr:preprotein translocase subunit YajC [Marinospirillum alkaliphilum]SFX29984.1 protein translocase subunit yajC [Marinospirillum alkaliphilum DSM 21637]